MYPRHFLASRSEACWGSAASLRRSSGKRPSVRADSPECVVLKPSDRKAALRALLNNILLAHGMYCGTSEFTDADAIKNEFQIAFFRRCFTLLNKNSFELDLETESLFVPGNTHHCREWTLEAIITKSPLPPCLQGWKGTVYNDVLSLSQ